MLDIIIFNKRI